MYIPNAIAAPGQDAMHGLMRAQPLAALVTLSAAGLDANHIPLQLFAEIGTHGVLRGHVARANPLLQEQPQPWSLEEAPADYIATMLNAIVGIEMPITRLEGKWKLSQNQPPANREGVIAGMQAFKTPR